MFIIKYTVLCLVFSVAFSALIEKYTGRICNLQKQEEVNDCLKKSIENMFKHHSKGVREIGFLPFNPLEINQATLSNNQGGPTELEIVWVKAKHYYIPNSTIQDVKYDVKTGHLHFVINNPLSQFNATYKLSGKILALPIHGHGNASIKRTKVLVNIDMDLKMKNGKDNKKHIRAENAKVGITSEKDIFMFENLFGNKELSDNMNVFFNENYKEVMADITPSLNAMYSKLLENIMDLFFDTLPAEELTIL